MNGETRFTVAINNFLCLKNGSAQISIFSTSNEESATVAIKKNKTGCLFGATSWTAVLIQPVYLKNGPKAGSSKATPRILIFSNAMGTVKFYRTIIGRLVVNPM